jgi:hypothetical protein
MKAWADRPRLSSDIQPLSVDDLAPCFSHFYWFPTVQKNGFQRFYFSGLLGLLAGVFTRDSGFEFQRDSSEIGLFRKVRFLVAARVSKNKILISACVSNQLIKQMLC